jgi:outer membrane receptor protein involved in Fe transport
MATRIICARARFLAGIAFVSGVAATPLHAQEANTQAAIPSDGQGDQAPPAGGGDIVVTGSRVITNGNNMPTPVTVVSTESLLESQPTGVVQALNNIPALLGSVNGTSNVNSGGYNQFNLRGIGASRALVLFNGHRLGPTRPQGQTNVDVVPQLLLQRVDVVTGGTSAVYGSDAVSGVVNFVVDTDFNGLKAEAQAGISRYKDDPKQRLGIAYGTKLGDRAHVEASYEFYNQEGFDREDRNFWTPNYTMQGSVVQPVGGVTSAPGTALNPLALVRDARIATSSWGGRINSGPFADLNFAQNGVLSPFHHGTRTGTSGIELGGDGAYFTDNTANTSQRIHRGYARFDYELSDTIRFHADGTYTNLTQGFRLQNPTLNLTIGYNNPFLDAVTVDSPTLTTAQFQATRAAQLAADPLSSFSYSKIDTQLPNYQARVKLQYWMATAGFEGKIGGIDWTADYYHTDSQERLTNLHNVSAAKLLAAANAVRDPSSGDIVCNAALVNPSVYGSCVPLDVFGPASANQAAMNYVNQVTTALTHYKTDDFSATLKASPFKLPGGDANFALSGEWRKLTMETISNVSPTDVVDCTGIQFGCVPPGGSKPPTTPYLSPNGANAVASRSPVSQTVKEVSLEGAFPLLADLPFIKALDLSAAARYTDYDTSGSVWTWKLGGVWRIADALTLRATRSRDIRAPNLNDLYAPLGLSPRSFTDLHTGGTTGFVNSQTQGNPNLTPEKADTLTIGGVLKPGFLPGFSLTVDYYRIKINNAIVNVDPLQGNTQVTCEESNGTDAVCALYVRPYGFDNRTAANYPTLLIGQSLNVASLKTYGIDFEANYSHDLAGRDLTLRALVNWQPHLIYNNGPSGIIDIGGAADGIGGLPITPEWKAVGSVTYNFTDALRVLVQERWRAKLKQNGSAAVHFVTGPVPARAYTDININYQVNSEATFFFNIQNLFDQAPAPFASNGGSSQPNYLGGFAQGDDLEGRYFTVGVRLRLR